LLKYRHYTHNPANRPCTDTFAFYAPSANLIRYNSCDGEVRHACPWTEREMAKTTPKAKNSAFMKPMQPSEHLAKIVGTEPLPRSEVTKKIWAHIKKHNLQNPKNKREILADDKLQPIFGGKKLDMFQMTKAVNKHLK
jgi:chromatin remodeling complex protein RSC6